MRNYKEHLILTKSKVKQALAQLDKLAKDAILFVIDEDGRLIGSLTDGDVRRGFLKNLSIENEVNDFLQSNPKFVQKNKYSLKEIIELRDGNFRILPVLDGKREVVNVINFRFLKSYLPIDAVIMAGGKGNRLKPLTEKLPKPLLKVGDKAIIDHGLDRLQKFGVDDIWITLNYMGEKIEAHLGNGSNNGLKIKYVWEDEPMGTIGAVSKVKEFKHEHILVTNSDILTNINYEDFYLDFLEKEADMSVVSIPYQVNVPYAVLETSDHKILSFAEKPTYTYYSNGGIYLVKRCLLKHIPINSFYNSTDLMQKLMENNYKVISYPLRQYWLDIGNPVDYEKAQEDVKHLQF